MNLQDFSDILEKGWPDDATIVTLPFGDQMKTLGDSKDYGNHVKDVVKCMNALISNAPISALTDATLTEMQVYVALFLAIFGEINGQQGIFSRDKIGQQKIEQFLRVAAFYHDIGKFIQRDRHPTVGYYHITLVQGTGAAALENILGQRLFRVLCDMVRYHDLFGVVGTGEGSLAALIDIIPFRTNDINEQLTSLSLLMLLNLADISGTVPLTSIKAGTIANDWKRFSKLLTASQGNRETFTRKIINADQTAGTAIERIRRLLLERVPNALRVSLDSPIDIEDILQVTLGPQFYEFCSDFSLICKFDYALRFIMELENYAAANNSDPKKVIEIVVALITRLVQSYSTLTRRADGSRRRIGIQVSGWSRTKAISDSLIKLLFTDLPRGLGWASEEASAWYLE